MSEIRFYNTLAHQIERFEPIDPPRVSMYNCGPTVYDFAHIGNFRAFVFADVLRRFLELSDYRVAQVMNITDVGHMTEDQLADGGGEDKMKLAARRLKEQKKSGAAPVENPEDPYQVASYYTRAFLDDARKLGLKIADEYPERMPRASQYVAQMQAMIRTLIERGHAYVTEDTSGASGGAVYFDVQSFPDYGKLSGNTLDKLRGGAGGRVLEEHQAAKRHPADFLLWKSDPAHIMKWDSPWGEGYPGWHIECSTMSLQVLSELAGAPLETIDIHTGGEDNIFPHHECEIAQSCAATGRDRFARFWMHTRFLLVEGQKMSKSMGNFHTVRDVLEGKVTGSSLDPAVLRYELFKAHYRSNMNFTVKGLADSASAVQRIHRFQHNLMESLGDQTSARPPQVSVDAHPMLRAFVEALSDDLNMSKALAAVFEWIAGEHPDVHASWAALEKVDRVLGIGLRSELERDGGELQRKGEDAGVQEKCRTIDEARRAKDFKTADAVRQELFDAGYEVTTTKAGTTARRKLA